jgi:hypothetical protein
MNHNPMRQQGVAEFPSLTQRVMIFDSPVPGLRSGCRTHCFSTNFRLDRQHD